MQDELMHFRTEYNDDLKEIKSELSGIKKKLDRHDWLLGMGIGMITLIGWYLQTPITIVKKYEAKNNIVSPINNIVSPINNIENKKIALGN